MKNDMRIGDDLIIIEEADFRGAVEAPRKVESSTFIIVEKGTSRLVLDGVEYALEAPSVVVLMHDQTFQLIEASEDISFKAVVMSQRFVDSLFGLYHQSDRLYSMIHDNPVIDIRHDEVSFRTFYSILVNAVKSPVKAFRLESARHATLSMLYYYAIRLESVEHEKTKADARYEQFCRDVRSFYKINRTLVFYAGRLGISVKYLTDLVKEKTGKECGEFRNGDHTTTLMRTARGKVVEIQHNVMTPQPYNRLFKLTGTKGYATKYPTPELALSGEALKGTGAPQVDNLNAHGFMSAEQRNAMMAKYYHPILAKYVEKGRELGHGGMDFVMDSRLVYCLQNGLPLDMDVYDLAEWCCLAELGTLSMDNNCAAVTFPDFTRGHWNEVEGYKHAYAPAADEAATEAYAEAYSAAQKKVTAQKNLWALYDAVKAARAAGNAKAEAAAQKKLDAAKASADKAIAKAVKKAMKK